MTRLSSSAALRRIVPVLAVCAAWSAAIAPPARAEGGVDSGVEKPRAAPIFHDGESVVRTTLRSARDLRTVLAISKDMLTHRIDFGPVEFVVDAKGLAALKSTDLAIEVLVPDLGAVLRADFAARNAQGEQGGDGDGGVAGTDFFSAFRRLEEINAKLDALAAARPDLVTTFSIGNSVEGRPIRGVRITKAAAGSPGILFNGTQHAREWGATTATCYIADRLVNGYGTDARITALLDRAWVDVIPVVNPDGYVYTWDVDRLWRKNRRNNGGGVYGVDLNRNWSYQWGGGGASANPSDLTYRGPSAFSEPESAAMRDYFLARATVVGHIDFHSYGQLILSPWGYTTAAPPNAVGLSALGNEMKASILRTNGVSYTTGPVASTLYVASGSSVDYALGVRGVNSWTIEVRDTGAYGFVMPVSGILPNATENLAAALDLADASVDGAIIRFAATPPATTPCIAPPTISAEVRALRGTLVAGGVKLFTRVGASGAFTPITMSTTGNGTYTAALPSVACGSNLSWYVAAQTTVGTARFPRAADATLTTVYSGVPADLNRDGGVNGADLSILLNSWGQPGAADLNGNGVTDASDLSILLNSWS
jgi:murein tripeptide amidase MpaA